jgi:Domain of unknown function (DUF4136)
MMKRSVLLLAALFITTAGSAVGQDISFNFDKDANFLKFKTYEWVPSKEPAPANELWDKQIKKTIDSEFAKKGLTRTDAGPADLCIGYQAGIGTAKQVMSCNAGWVCVAGWYVSGCFSFGGTGGTTAGRTSTIYEGDLVLNVFDRQSHELVWCGVASKTLKSKAKPGKQQKNLEKAVAKLLKSYPPPKK